MKKKILFIMHLDWKFVKQRPHFIAEELSKFYDIKIIYFSSKDYFFNKSKSNTPNDKKLNMYPAIRLPFYQNEIVYKLNKAYMQFFFKLIVNHYKPDYLWVTFPVIYDYIPLNNNYKIIYDCMDNMTIDNFSEKFLIKVLKLEKQLLKRANLVFVPSKTLAKLLNERNACNNKLIIINNAFDGKIIRNTLHKTSESKIFKIGYIGTISSWFDYELLEASLNKFDQIEYHVIGPKNNVNFKFNERIKFYGAIEHDKLYDYIKNFDALIMPFKLNEIIIVADPVKFYDYINFNLPILSIFFEEVKRYNNFVSFYSNESEFFQLLKELIDNKFVKKYSDQLRIKFLKSNSWKNRVSTIRKHLEQME